MRRADLVDHVRRQRAEQLRQDLDDVRAVFRRDGFPRVARVGGRRLVVLRDVLLERADVLQHELVLVVDLNRASRLPEVRQNFPYFFITNARSTLRPKKRHLEGTGAVWVYRPVVETASTWRQTVNAVSYLRDARWRERFRHRDERPTPRGPAEPGFVARRDGAALEERPFFDGFCGGRTAGGSLLRARWERRKPGGRLRSSPLGRRDFFLRICATTSTSKSVSPGTLSEGVSAAVGSTASSPMVVCARLFWWALL